MNRSQAEFSRFFVVGCVGLAADLGSLWILLELGTGVFYGRFLSFSIAVVTTWQLNRTITFRRTGNVPIWQEFGKYYSAMILGGAVNLLIYSLIVFSIKDLSLVPYIGVAAGSAAGLTVNFLSAKYWAFMPRPSHKNCPPTAEDNRDNGQDPTGIALPTPPGSSRALIITSILVPICFGFYSLLLGVDTNWDLRNYHLYNVFAWLNDKHLIDHAPAGMQSYFNPLLHTFHYFAYQHLPPRLVGFGMGFLHGLCYPILLAICLRLTPDLHHRTAILLALAGCLTGAFLSGLGNSMGDNTTALFVLTGLLVIICGWDTLLTLSPRAFITLSLAGLVVGLGVGLKLTNAVFAVAICLALLGYPGSFGVKLRLGLVFGLGTLIGLLLSAGFWFVHLWNLFGNPLFPQFSNLFPNPLTSEVAVGDLRWRPGSLWENLVWPFIMSIDPRRVGEVPVRQIIWPMLFLLMLYWTSAQWRAKQTMQALDGRARFVLAYVIVGFIVWMQLFSIYRYVVAIEVLTPLALWIMLHQTLSFDKARQLAKWMLIAATLVVVFGGAKTWGHKGWTDPLLSAELPNISDPARTSVVIASPTKSTPWTWLAILFPPEVAFMQVQSSFPGTALFGERMRKAASERGGPVYAIVDGHHNRHADIAAELDAWAESWGLTGTAVRCSQLKSFAAQLRLRYQVDTVDKPGKHCRISIRPDLQINAFAANRELAEAAAAMLKPYGFQLHISSCIPRMANIGTGRMSYQWCQVSLLTL